MNKTPRLPSLKSLQAFAVAGRHESFKQAAEELFLSASAVSHQVKNLEEFLGFDLFVRKTRALELTEAGQQYYEFLDSMFARLESETHQLRTEFGRSVIRLCVPPFLANELLLPKLDDLETLIPDTDIRLSTQTSLMQQHPAEADLSILLGNNDWPELVTYPLFARRLVVAAAPSLLKGFDAKSFDSLNGQTLIVHESRPNTWNNWARALDIDPPVAAKILRFDSMSTLVQAAARGLGFAIVSWPLSDNWFQSGSLVKVYDTEWVTDEHFYLAHRVDEDLRDDVASLKDWLLTECRLDG